MRLIGTFIIFIIGMNVLPAQNLTGVWRGTFEQSEINSFNGRTINKDTYKYEVQINDKDNGTLDGVTYSYLTTRFYGKATLKGRSDKKNKTLTIKETFLVEMKGSGDGCLMTCYLDYKKIGKTETLIGTYSSVNIRNKESCPSGTVYLEKVENSDFALEDFLKKNKESALANAAAKRKLPSGKNFETERKEEAAKNKTVIPTPNTSKKTSSTNATKPNNIVSKNKPTVNTGVVKNNGIKASKNNANNSTANNTNKPLIKQKPTKPVVLAAKPPKDSVIVAIKDTAKPIAIKPTEIKPESKKIAEPADAVLIERENKLTAKIAVDTKDVVIEFYDNGDIDNDTISVYKDNKLDISKARLSLKPIVLTLHFDEINTFYEITTVAENLGDIPPNTALMVINFGKKREEVFLTSDDKQNAKVIIQYKTVSKPARY